jgi:hypothetical protein
MGIHEQILEEQKSIENNVLGGHPIQLAYRATGVSISGWIGEHYETVSGHSVPEVAVKFRELLDDYPPIAQTPVTLRKQAQALLAKAEAMEACK